ncbi:hypothetical protein [Paraburkholderia sacchari]|uniref:hypothetical protein n=1 Tax=Paraburkholderia sacchari TaxID=159450 RepID=UPI001BCD697A|nr:hypothetical protein [Paraburkholderia sacchari]
MSTQIFRDQSSPAACKRCGHMLLDDVDLCPYCGMHHPLDRVSLDVRPRIMPGALGAMAAGPPAPAAARLSPTDLPAPERETVKPQYLDGPLEHEALSRFTPRWIFTKGLLLAGIFLTIVYAAHLLIAEIRRPSSPADEQSAHTSGGSIAYIAPGQPTAADTGSQSATTKPQVMPPLGDVSDNPREQRRDSALRIAEQCASEHVWGCVQQKASEALAIDSNSQHARALMERAIVATGWAPLSAPNPPGALNRAARTAAAANQSATAHAAIPPSNGNGNGNGNSNSNSADAAERAIVQDGWKHASPANAAH